MTLKFTTAYITRQGGRKYNEDFCGFSKAGGNYCWVVADGLGGHGGGAQASKLAVNTVLKQFESKAEVSPEGLTQYLDEAQNTILAKQAEDPKLAFMRTTSVVMISDGQVLYYAHIGDTRLYFLRAGWSERALTKDHSVTQVMADTGEISYKDMRMHVDRNKLLRAMGNQQEYKPDISQTGIELRKGDAFLLCTDGFWEYVDEIALCADFAKAVSPEEWLTMMELRLLSVLREKRVRSNDNYTAMGIFVE